MVLVAAAAGAQEIPYPTNGSGLDSGNLMNQMGQGYQMNCSDPLMAASSSCSGTRGLGGSMLGGTLNGLSPYSQLPGYQQGQSSIYTDDQGRLTSRDRSVAIPLPPEPLTEFQ
jgi:hypothetical protein